MSVSGLDYINPRIKYNFYSDFYIGEKSQSVYVIKEQNENKVINFNEIPFKSGNIKFVDKQSYCGKPEQVNINGEIYNVGSSMPFKKGSYCGRQYDLASKIDYINQNLRDGEPQYCPNVRLTHEGNAILVNGRTRPLAVLDLPAIEKAYSETYNRLHPPSPCYQLAQSVAFVAIALAIRALISK